MENNEKGEKRDCMVHIAFFKQEKEEIKKLSKESNMTASEFMRQAIFDKIRRIKHPELFTQTSNQVNPIFFEQITKELKKLNEKQEKILERDKIFNEMKKTLDLIQRFSIKQDLKEETVSILNLLKAHKSLSQEQIIEMTNFDKDIVFQVISNKKLFKLNIETGRFSKR